ncbi:MAG: glutathione S-transferase N-terminal domain-containing protein [Deltaproteobacteria bacterium]|nr:glutathione S-transferase N-terminal domain-containing protein [Deltaproteobacteria bacterium]
MAKPTPELLHLPYSPWSEKARWALECRRVPYRSRVYQPLLGEPELRLRLKRARGLVTVPVLFTTAGALTDSLEIARWASERGEGPDLFPRGADPEIFAWNALGERALAAGRVLSLRRVLKDRAALGELVPRRLRPVLGRLGAVVAAQGVKRTLRKYADVLGGEDPTAVIDGVLAELRRGLGDAPVDASGAPRTLLASGFSYADITMAQALGFVSPPETGIRIGPANRAAFTDADLASRHADLIAWRDALYRRYRAT